MPTYVIDAMCLLWYLEDNPKLSVASAALMDDQNAKLIISAIAVAEVCHIILRQKVKIQIDEVRSIVEQDTRVEVLNLSWPVIALSNTLGVLSEIHDRLIVASALSVAHVSGFQGLVTCDRAIRASGLVKTIW